MEARRFFRQIISAVAYMHEKGLAHRDLKPVSFYKLYWFFHIENFFKKDKGTFYRIENAQKYTLSHIDFAKSIHDPLFQESSKNFVYVMLCRITLPENESPLSSTTRQGKYGITAPPKQPITFILQNITDHILCFVLSDPWKFFRTAIMLLKLQKTFFWVNFS